MLGDVLESLVCVCVYLLPPPPLDPVQKLDRMISSLTCLL